MGKSQPECSYKVCSYSKAPILASSQFISSWISARCHHWSIDKCLFTLFASLEYVLSFEKSYKIKFSVFKMCFAALGLLDNMNRICKWNASFYADYSIWPFNTSENITSGEPWPSDGRLYYHIIFWSIAGFHTERTRVQALNSYNYKTWLI